MDIQLEYRINQVALTQQTPTPPIDLGNDIWQQAQAIVRREYWDSNNVAEGNQYKKVFQGGALTNVGADHIVKRHPVHDLEESVKHFIEANAPA